MKVLLDIKENNRVPFFMEMIRSLDYINVIKEFEEDVKNQIIDDWKEAFDEIKLHEQGKQKLKSAKDLLDEI